MTPKTSREPAGSAHVCEPRARKDVSLQLSVPGGSARTRDLTVTESEIALYSHQNGLEQCMHSLARCRTEC